VQINGAGFHAQAVNFDIPVPAAVGKAHWQSVAPGRHTDRGAVTVNNNGPIGSSAVGGGCRRGEWLVGYGRLSDSRGYNTAGSDSEAGLANGVPPGRACSVIRIIWHFSGL